jgi:hypothetical protein
MLGRAIGAQALGDGGLRELASERSGPRPGGVAPGAADKAAAEVRTGRATRP